MEALLVCCVLCTLHTVHCTLYTACFPCKNLEILNIYQGLDLWNILYKKHVYNMHNFTKEQLSIIVYVWKKRFLKNKIVHIFTQINTLKTKSLYAYLAIFLCLFPNLIIIISKDLCKLSSQYKIFFLIVFWGRFNWL